MSISKDNRQVCKRCGRYMVEDNRGWSHWDNSRYKCKCGMERLITTTANYDLVKHPELSAPVRVREDK